MNPKPYSMGLGPMPLPHGIYECYTSPSLCRLGDLERQVQGVQGAGRNFVVILGDLCLRSESLDMLRTFFFADLDLAKGVELFVALRGYYFDVSTVQRFLERSIRCSESTSPSARTSEGLYAHPCRTSFDTYRDLCSSKIGSSGGNARYPPNVHQRYQCMTL